VTLPTALDLSAPPEWRAAPMPGANQPLQLVRLASPRDRFTIHGLFPRGFERVVPGGYAAAEEFLVLEGELELEGVVYRRGDLTVVPAAYPRTAMRSTGGCRVLAWFAGPPAFVPHEDLPPCEGAIQSVSVDATGDLPGSPVASWARGALPDGDGEVEVVSAGLDRWCRATGVEPAARDLVRRERR
jgi:hypothetical protein